MSTHCISKHINKLCCMSACSCAVSYQKTILLHLPYHHVFRRSRNCVVCVEVPFCALVRHRVRAMGVQRISACSAPAADTRQTRRRTIGRSNKILGCGCHLPRHRHGGAISPFLRFAAPVFHFWLRGPPHEISVALPPLLQHAVVGFPVFQVMKGYTRQRSRSSSSSSSRHQSPT